MYRQILMSFIVETVEGHRVKRGLFFEDGAITACLCGSGNDPATKETLIMWEEGERIA